MRRYLVVVATPDGDYFSAHTGDRGPNGERDVVFVDTQEAVRMELVFSPSRKVYYFESMEERDRCAARLARQFPNISFMTATAETVYTTVPSDVKRAKFSDRGLLPE